MYYKIVHCKMVRIYKKKTNRANISEGNMKNAVQEILSKRMYQREASKCFGVKRETLLSKIKELPKKYSDGKLTKLYKDDSGNESDNNKEALYNSKYSVSQWALKFPIFYIYSHPVLPKDHAIPSTSTADDIPSYVIPISITPEKPLFGSVKKCSKFIPTPDLVRPFPRPCIEKKKNGENKKGKSRIYTDTPEKNRNNDGDLDIQNEVVAFQQDNEESGRDIGNTCLICDKVMEPSKSRIVKERGIENFKKNR
ncbi:hypothetical protein JTB14_011314 [Gonioctena quinquepunctata]|nr:hypothetical protein JTB14_011314 [Gonioctena quinquepunctata]